MDSIILCETLIDNVDGDRHHERGEIRLFDLSFGGGDIRDSTILSIMHPGQAASVMPTRLSMLQPPGWNTLIFLPSLLSVNKGQARP
jgi:hypothetical protein